MQPVAACCAGGIGDPCTETGFLLCRRRRPSSLASAATRFAACLAGGGMAPSTANITSGSRTTPAHTTGRLQGSSGSGGCEYSSAAWGGAAGGRHAELPGSGDPAGHPPSGAQLVRDFIHDSLYHPLEGYFTRRSASGEADRASRFGDPCSWRPRRSSHAPSSNLPVLAGLVRS